MAHESRPLSAVLFCQEDGKALKFFIRPSLEKTSLRPLIEGGGGVLSSKHDGCGDWIKFAVEGDKVSSDDYLRTDYIHDCVAANQLLPMEQYKYQHQIQPNRSASPTTSVLSNITVGKGRSVYSEADDDAILTYIAKRTGSSFSGNQIWKKMELLKVTEHSWQSMRHRFLKKLQDSLPRYVKLRQKRRAESAALSSSTEASNAEDNVVAEVGAFSSSLAKAKEGTTQKNLSTEPPEPMESSGGSDESDFDLNLLAEAERHSPSKEMRESSHDAEDEESDSDPDNDRPRGTHKKVVLRYHKGTTNDYIPETTEDSTSVEDEESMRQLTKRRKRQALVAHQADSPVLGEVPSRSTDSQQGRGAHNDPTTVSMTRASLKDRQSQESLTLGISSDDNEDDFNKDVDEVVIFIQKAMEEFSVSAEVVGQLMYIHSGVHEATLEHLRTGKLPEGMKVWTVEDDMKLINSSNPRDINELRRKYGEEAVMKHQAFFEGC